MEPQLSAPGHDRGPGPRVARELDCPAPETASSPALRHAAAPASIQRLADVIACLRAPDGCPWDRAQTHTSLAPYAVEETYELLDAIDSGDPAALREELGDVLLQVVLHAELAAGDGHFVLQDVIDGIAAKMVRRHPHVFDSAAGATSDAAAVAQSWKAAKRREGRGVLAGVPRSMPALDRADRVSRRAAAVGFDFPTADDAIGKVHEELSELEAALASRNGAEIESELGDLLFAVVNAGRKLGVDPARALAGTLDRFGARFAHVEARLAERGASPETASLAEMEALWVEAKEAAR